MLYYTLFLETVSRCLAIMYYTLFLQTVSMWGDGHRYARNCLLTVRAG